MARLLLVEDEADIRTLARYALEDAGHEVIEVADGQQALELLLEGCEADAVLLDLAMPRVDGFGVLEALRREGRLERLPVIVVSANCDAKATERVYDLGVRTCVPKPFQSQELLEAVEEALG